MARKHDTIPVISPFNPLAKKNLGESVAIALLEQTPCALPPKPFIGAGIYAIYYTGNFPLYGRVTERNREGCFKQPIYVGKAVPPGARKGGFGLGEEPGQALYKRLFEYANSINDSQNLQLSDFYCRFLVVEDIWIPLAESLLIEMFSPLWNRVIDGFGNHDPGKGRYNQQKSAWDSLHPGRAWAERLQPLELSSEQLLAKIEAYLSRSSGG